MSKSVSCLQPMNAVGILKKEDARLNQPSLAQALGDESLVSSDVAEHAAIIDLVEEWRRGG